MIPKIQLRRCLSALLIAVSLVTHSQCFGQANASADPLSIEFGGVTYLHRWTKAGQHEFTPNGQEDLARWLDMVTVNIHHPTRDGDQLALLANQVLGNYKAVGKIVATHSVPRTDKAPAQHLIVAVLRGSNLMETVFARFLLVDDQGVVVVHSHREYGASAASVTGPWLEKNGSERINALMKWTGLPTLDVLKQLPDSR